MRPTLLKSGWFWSVWLVALALDLLSKAQWGVVYRQQTVWAGWILLIMLAVFLARLWAIQLNRSLAVGLALLAAGITGNAVDVVTRGGVRDWLSWFTWRTNLADIFVWCGLVVWIWAIKKSSTVGPERI